MCEEPKLQSASGWRSNRAFRLLTVGHSQANNAPPFAAINDMMRVINIHKIYFFLIHLDGESRSSTTLPIQTSSFHACRHRDVRSPIFGDLRALANLRRASMRCRRLARMRKPPLQRAALCILGFN